jgi:lysophospholipase L1-like esterase
VETQFHTLLPLLDRYCQESKKMKTLLFGIFAIVATSSMTMARQSDGDRAAHPMIHLIGDSTMSDKPLSPAQPERGWGQLLPLYMKHPESVRNYARNGRSSKSFESEGLWDKVEQSLQPGDFVVIQFGHNDEKKDSPERYTDPKGSFPEQLGKYVDRARAKRAHPILATPIVRRRFDGHGEFVETHGEYPDAIRSLALAKNVPLLDLHARSRMLLMQYGPERSKGLYLWIDKGLFTTLPDGKQDDTHLSAEGASRICELAIDELRHIAHPLAIYAK